MNRRFCLGYLLLLNVLEYQNHDLALDIKGSLITLVAETQIVSV